MDTISHSATNEMSSVSFTRIAFDVLDSLIVGGFGEFRTFPFSTEDTGLRRDWPTR